MKLVQILNGMESIRKLNTIQNGSAALRVHRILKEADEFRNDFSEVRDLYLQQNAGADNPENEKNGDFREFIETVLTEDVEPSWANNKLPRNMIVDSQLTAQDVIVLETLGVIEEEVDPVVENRENRLKAFQTLKQS